MNSHDLIEKIEDKVITGDVSALDEPVAKLIYDSRKFEPGAVFVCIKGLKFDGHDTIAEGIEKGVRVFIISDESAVERAAEKTDISKACFVRCADTRKALALTAAAYFGHPAEKLKVVGITGTKGKTTTTYMAKSILENSGFKVGLIGTIEIIIGDEHIPASNTTPESYLIQEYFRRMVDAGLQICVMEVSSQGLMMSRVDGFTFDMGIFTNLSPDHIGAGEHASYEEYVYWKSRLFEKCRIAAINGDDEEVVKASSEAPCEILTYGIDKPCDLMARDITYKRFGYALGAEYRLERQGGDIDIVLHLPGEFSVYNSLAAAAICTHFGVEPDVIRDSLKNAGAKGRIEMVPVSEDYTLMIDYAHNAMALESLLKSLKIYMDTKGAPSRLVCLFGCGGNRAKSRRYEMGEVSGRMADLTIITSDNPRFEKPQDIIDDIKIGISKTDGKYVEIADRKEAIRYAILNAQKNDVIVLAGKGHEDYQEIEGVKYPMDERGLIRDILSEENITPVGRV